MNLEAEGQVALIDNTGIPVCQGLGAYFLWTVGMKIRPAKTPKFPAERFSPKHSDIRKNAAARINFFIAE